MDDLSHEQWNDWDKKGFIVLKGFFSSADINIHNSFIDQLWKTRKEKRNQSVCDVFLNSEQQQRKQFFKVTDNARQHPYKLNDLYLTSPEVRSLSLNETLCGVLSQLLSGDPIVINSLNIEFGTQQPDHIDTFFMPPTVTNMMLASWIALDYAHLRNGPLRIYPGSHKIPPYLFSNGKLKAIDLEMPDFNRYIKDELEKRDIQEEFFIAEPGDVLIWHAQLLHGGENIHHMSTRKSLVTHYFRTKDQWRRFWRIRKHGSNGFYLKRPHQPIDAV